MVAIFPAAQVHTFTCDAEIRGLHTRKRGKSVYSLIRFVAVDIVKLQRFKKKKYDCSSRPLSSQGTPSCKLTTACLC